MLSPGQLGRGRDMQTPHPACWLVNPLPWPLAQQSSRARAGDLPVSSRRASGLAGVKQLSLPITMFPARTFHPDRFCTVWDCVAALGRLQSHDCVPFSPAKVRGKVWHAAAAQLGLLQLAVQGSTSGRAVLCVTGILPSTSPGSKLICNSNLGDTRVTCCALAAGTSWERDLLTGENKMQRQRAVPSSCASGTITQPSPKLSSHPRGACPCPVAGMGGKGLKKASFICAQCWKALEGHRPRKLPPTTAIRNDAHRDADRGARTDRDLAQEGSQRWAEQRAEPG